MSMRSISVVYFAVMYFAAALFASASARAEGEKVTIRLSGSVPEKCEFRFANIRGDGRSAAVDVGEMNGDFRAALPFRLDCNVPVKYIIRAENGALRHKTFAGVAPKGFRAEQSYGLRIETSQAGKAMTIAEGALGGGREASGDSGAVAPHAMTGTLSLFKGAKAGGELIAGEYSDTLTVTIEPKG